MSNLTVKLEGPEVQEFISKRNAQRLHEVNKINEGNNMGLIRRVGESEFVDDLLRDDYAHWSVAEARALYEYYNEVSDCFENGLEIDRVMVRCEWSSYKNFDEVLEVYDFKYSMDSLMDMTQAIILDDSILIQDF
jgi:hypothetical protein